MNTALRNSLLTGLICFLVCSAGWAQNGKSYELLPYPDVWYNDVDGIRAGVRVTGQVPGTFEDGPHRLNAGVWIGTWWPEHPVSYYVDFTEPIPSISGFNSEGNVQLVSSIRTGISRHGLRFNKRWQQGFDEQQFVKISADFTGQKRFDLEYVHYPHIWQQDWLWLGSAEVQLNNANPLGRYQLKSRISANLVGEAPSFVHSATEFKQRVFLGKGFGIRGRIFVGLTSDQAVPEFQFGRSFRPPTQWIENSLVRAKGTIPKNWMESGIFQVSGAGNLRGYTSRDISSLEDGQPPLLSSIGALNVEIDYPNPLDRAIRNIPTIGELLRLRSYFFSDTGTSLGLSQNEENSVLSDAGLGFMFSLNIPDFLGNPRGIMLRYDIPLWLSHPQDDQHVEFRSVVGIGAIFTF